LSLITIFFIYVGFVVVDVVVLGALAKAVGVFVEVKPLVVVVGFEAVEPVAEVK
jgi:hypothetical protein